MAVASTDGDTQRQVWDAAVRLFAAKGFHGTGIRELADAANLSSASLYHYMGTKEDLLAGIMRDSLERLLRTAAEVVEQAPSPPARLGSLVQLHVLTHALLPLETTVVDNEIRALSPASRREIVALRDSYELLWRTAIEDGCRGGEFRTTAPGVARLALLEMCSGVARWYSPRGPLGLDEIAIRHAEIAFHVLQLDGDPTAVPLPDLAHYTALVSRVWGVRVPTTARRNAPMSVGSAG